MTAAVGWLVTGDGLVAVTLAVLADFLAGIPTLRKAWSHPASESSYAFIGGAISGITGLLTVSVFTATTVMFPAYILAICIVLVALMTIRWRPNAMGAAAQ